MLKMALQHIMCHLLLLYKYDKGVVDGNAGLVGVVGGEWGRMLHLVSKLLSLFFSYVWPTFDISCESAA